MNLLDFPFTQGSSPTGILLITKDLFAIRVGFKNQPPQRLLILRSSKNSKAHFYYTRENHARKEFILQELSWR